MKFTSTILLAAVLHPALSAEASAQSFFMPSDTPATGTCNSIPFGQTSFVYQTLATNADLGGAIVLDICELAFSSCTGSGILHFDTIEITMAQSSSATLSNTFAANLQQNPQVVLQATNYDWAVTGDEWSRIGLDKSYQADVHAFGVGCPGSNGVPTLSPTGDGKIGGSFGIDVVNCVATTPVLHVLGLTRFASPVDLGFTGAPGCFLYHSVDVLLGGVTDGSGGFKFTTAIPNDTSLRCARVYTQVAPFDATANAWNRTSSNYARLLVGN